MVLYILRGAFILLVASVTMLYVLPFQKERQVDFATVVLMLGLTLGVAAAIVAIDGFVRRKRLSAISGVFLGLLAGLLAALALSFVVDLIGLLTAPEINFDLPRTAAEYKTLSSRERELLESRQSYLNLLEGVKVFIGLVTCYLCISLVIQTKDDFRFVIPYVEFAKQVRGNRPTLLDTSVVIDGRVLDIVGTRAMQGTLIVPKFVLNELQTIADSADKLRRARGRRGLDILQKLQDNQVVEVVIEDRDAEGGNVDQKLVALAQQMQARIMTNDYNLNKIATLRGVDVINLNDLAKSLRPVVLPGEQMTVKIIKPGEGASQGIGYLEDGTMVVVEQGREVIGREIDLVVTSTLQTSAGRMIFGRLAGIGDAVRAAGPSPHAGEPAVAVTTVMTDADKAQGRSPNSHRASGRNPRRG
ncbi:MAG: PIN domain-containing protein [Phycisphaeraceae bacterium]